jgi:hypothetical protein
MNELTPTQALRLATLRSKRDAARERVSEFLRQWDLRQDHPNVIMGIHVDPEARLAELNASDVATLMPSARERAMAHARAVQVIAKFLPGDRPEELLKALREEGLEVHLK